MNQLLLFALFTHFLILQLSNPLSPPDIRVTQPYVLLSSRCGVTQLTGLSLHTSSTPPLTPVLNPPVGSSSSLPLLPSGALHRSELANLCELNAKPTEHQQWELPSLSLYFSLYQYPVKQMCAQARR